MISASYRLCSFPLDQYKIAVSQLLNTIAKTGFWCRKQGREEGKDACVYVPRYAYLEKRQGMFACIHTKKCVTYIPYMHK